MLKMKNNESLNLYTRDEIKELLKMEERLVFVDDGIDEVIARFKDLPDVIVDICRRFGYRDFKIYNFIEPTDKPIITTNGVYLDKCSTEDRQALIKRLVALQQYEEEIREYKVISEEDLVDYYNSLEGVKEMKQSIVGEKQQYDEELDLLYKRGIIDIDELDEMQRQKRNTQER